MDYVTETNVSINKSLLKLTGILIILGSISFVISLRQLLNLDAPKIDTISQIEKLAKLKENGILTNEEFTKQKKKLLSYYFISEKQIMPPPEEITKKNWWQFWKK